MIYFYANTRRRWMALVIIVSILTTRAYTQELLDPQTQPQFVNPLPVPGVIDGRNGGLFTISISQFDQWLGLVNPVTKQHMLTSVWGYNGTYPGPTILARKNIPIDVFWRNNLVDMTNNPLPHLLPIDPTIKWAYENVANWQLYGVPVVTHLHGGHSESASDGLPDAWFSPHFALKGKGFVKGEFEPYHYSNDQEAATIWYHDHAFGITRLNVYAGLAGYYLLTDNNEIELQTTGMLPAPPYDLGLAIQDRMFKSNGQLYYPSMHDEGNTNPSIIPEFFGDFILVNGMTWPVLEVEPRQYRFRVLNGSDSRFYNLFLSNKIAFQQIGTDDGLLPSPVSMTQMLIAPGERKDIILDFSNPNLWGQTIIVHNNAKTPFPRGTSIDPKSTGQIMAFRVNKPLNTQYPLTQLPQTLREPIVKLQSNLPVRKLILFEAEDEYGRLKPMLGTVEKGVMSWHDPVTENPMLNSTEIWEIYNETEDAHPIHLHMVSTQLVSRQKFFAQVDGETGKPTDIRVVGQPRLPNADENGWKDTWVMMPREVTRVIARFDIEGLYAWHCHILSHEDHEMMRPYFVGEMNKNTNVNAAQKVVPPLKDQLQLQTYPNPFTNNLFVRFVMPQAGNVKLQVYDANGSLVRNVYHGNIGQGWHEFKVDGSTWTPGVYNFELVFNQQRLVQKVILSSH